MNVYLISYDLSHPDTYQHYNPLIQHIKSEYSWAKPLKSVWLVKTTKTASQVRDGLRSLALPNDKIFVIDVSAKIWAFSHIDPEVVQWVRNNIMS